MFFPYPLDYDTHVALDVGLLVHFLLLSKTLIESLRGGRLPTISTRGLANKTRIYEHYIIWQIINTYRLAADEAEVALVAGILKGDWNCWEEQRQERSRG